MTTTYGGHQPSCHNRPRPRNRETTMDATITIRTGWLTGDVWQHDEVGAAGLDRDASLARYRELVEDAILAAYPTADLTITVQEGDGSPPWDCRTRVYLDPEDEERERQIVEHVDTIGDDVWQDDEWYVDADDA